MTPYYSDDLVTLYHGDARDIEGTVRGRADLVLTDPPYGLNRAYGGQNRSKREARRIAGDANADLLIWTAATASRWMKDDAWAAIFCGWNREHEVRAELEKSGLHVQTVIVWDKGRFSPVGRGVRDQHEFIVLARRGRPATPWDGGNVWRFARVHAPTHPTEKPVPLMRAVISRLLVPGGGLVFDPFAGSGPTLRAAKDSGHRVIGVEIDERWCRLAAESCSQDVLGLSA
jgi:site-specific DNA-methyltransferase (adenine-specific)